MNDPPIFSGTRRCVSQLVGCVVSTLYLGNYPPAIHAAINILSKGIDEGTSNQHQPFFSAFEYPIVRTIRSGCPESPNNHRHDHPLPSFSHPKIKLPRTRPHCGSPFKLTLPHFLLSSLLQARRSVHHTSPDHAAQESNPFDPSPPPIRRAQLSSNYQRRH